MARIDAHQHFWKYDPIRHSWIDDDMKVIQRDFMPADLKPLLDRNGFDGCVAVQVDQNQAENEFLLTLANANPFIKGVVGWVDLQSDTIESTLAKLHAHKKLKGFRHILQGEADEAYMLRPAFKTGIGKLQKYGFTYDILIFPNHLRNAARLVAEFPGQSFVIDHLAKPYIKAGDIEGWRNDMQALAKFPNVSCKISGMVTEAEWKGWKKEDFTLYLDVVVEAFGTGRLMFGSDWPVCLCAASYAEVVGIVEAYFTTFSESEKAAVWGGNAVKFYNLE